jgi:hypothetical protein
MKMINSIIIGDIIIILIKIVNQMKVIIMKNFYIKVMDIIIIIKELKI